MAASIGIIGLGRLGLCLALNLERVGYTIYAYDSNVNYTKEIEQKILRSSEPNVVEYLKDSNQLFICNSEEQILNNKPDLIFIIVPTPSKSDGSYDHQFIDQVIESILHARSNNQQINLVINSTTFPGYCSSLEDKLHGSNISIAYNPEFIAQGSIIRDQQYPDQVLIGSSDFDLIEKVKSIYKKLCKSNPEYCEMDLTSAEIAKLATNCFLTTKISFANSIGDLAIKAGANPDKILNAIGADHRIGKQYLKYGDGFGGPCFPRDNRALIQFGKRLEQELKISEATDAINQDHLQFQLNTILNDNSKDAYEFDGISYKKGSSIIEESQRLALAIELVKSGKKVIISESSEVIQLLENKYPGMFQLISND